MDASFATVAMSTPTIVLSYAAAFFFVVVAIAAAYALVKAGKTLDRVEIILNDVDKEAVPLMQKAGVTLDGVNANLGNVDQITKDVADITDKIDTMANVVEGAVSTPARKAAAFGAGVQGAVSSFMRRDKGAPADTTADWAQTGQGADAWTTPATGAADAAADATATAGDATATAAQTTADAASSVAGEAGAAVAVRRRCRGRNGRLRAGERHRGLIDGALDQAHRQRRRRGDRDRVLRAQSPRAHRRELLRHRAAPPRRRAALGGRDQGAGHAGPRRGQDRGPRP